MPRALTPGGPARPSSEDGFTGNLGVDYAAELAGIPAIVTSEACAEPGRGGDAPSADAAVVRAAASGDAGAFEILYERYGRMVRGILLARVSRTDVSDLLQDVFLTAWRRLPSLRDSGAFGGWLAMIARNRATDHYRRAADEVELPETIVDDRTLAGEAAAGAAIDARAALRAIRALPDAYRETLVLRLLEGMTGPEIAARTGLKPASVRVNLHRGMKLLREALGR